MFELFVKKIVAVTFSYLVFLFGSSLNSAAQASQSKAINNRCFKCGVTLFNAKRSGKMQEESICLSENSKGNGVFIAKKLVKLYGPYQVDLKFELETRPAPFDLKYVRATAFLEEVDRDGRKVVLGRDRAFSSETHHWFANPERALAKLEWIKRRANLRFEIENPALYTVAENAGYGKNFDRAVKAGLIEKQTAWSLIAVCQMEY